MAAEKAATGAQSNGMQNEIRAAFGQVNVDQDTSTQKTPIMSFSNGNVYIGLKLVSTFDQKTNTRRDPVPRITARRWPWRWKVWTFRTPPSTTTWTTPRT